MRAAAVGITLKARFTLKENQKQLTELQRLGGPKACKIHQSLFTPTESFKGRQRTSRANELHAEPP